MRESRVQPDKTVLTRPGPSSEDGRHALVRILTSPLGLAGLVLVLVSLSGVAATITTHSALRRAGEARAEAALEARAGRLRSSVREALSVADPLLDRLLVLAGSRAPDAPPESLLPVMAELATARRSLTWVSLSFPDGTFVGMRTEAGRLEGSVSSVATATETRYRAGADGRFAVVSRSPSSYDPRGRAFYRVASRLGRRAWTDPYPFLPDLRTGITRAAPLVENGRLVAVATVDFDADDIAALLGRPSPGEHFLVTMDDAVLATAGLDEIPRAARSPERPLSVGDLHDPIIVATKAALASGAPRVEGPNGALRHGRSVLASLDGTEVVLHSLVDERVLFARAREEARNGALRTTITALFAIAIALTLSRQIANLRKRREAAEREAERARAEADELGSYELVEPLGAGGMGEVWRARHKLLARDAALKLIKGREDHLDDGSDRARFFEEARLLASMRSIHTVAVYDFGIAADGRYFLAMELLEGLDLDALVRTHGPQPAARVAAMLSQVCDSLAEAHASGLVHQDVKPANIFLCRLAESLDMVKVLDFGLTRAIGRRRTDGRTEGTPAFMSPEQARGEAVSASTDLYAIGCVAFFLLTGRYPYEGSSSEEYMTQHVTAKVPELPDDVKARVPASLVALVKRCLAKDPDHRPVSALALGTALRSIAASCAETFDEDAKAAFWAKRDPRSRPMTPGDFVGASTVREAVPAGRRIRRSTAG